MTAVKVSFAILNHKLDIIGRLIQQGRDNRHWEHKQMLKGPSPSFEDRVILQEESDKEHRKELRKKHRHREDSTWRKKVHVIIQEVKEPFKNKTNV